MPTRFPAGITTVRKADPLGEFILPDPTAAHVFFEDFDYFVSGDWTFTSVDGGSDAGEVNALADADGGVLTVTTNDADNDSEFAQKKGESFLLESGKKTWLKARFKVSDATQSDFIMGLAITDTTPLDASDYIWFRKDDGDANLDFVVAKNSTATTEAAIHTMADDTYVEVAFYYDGIDNIAVWVDGGHKANVAVTNLPDDEELTVSFGIQAGEAAAKTMSVDYILAAKAR